MVALPFRFEFSYPKVEVGAKFCTVLILQKPEDPVIVFATLRGAVSLSDGHHIFLISRQPVKCEME